MATDTKHPRQGRGGRPYVGGGPLGSNENDREFAKDFRKSQTWSAIPSEKAFTDAEDAKFLEAPVLAEMAARLIGEYEELSWLAEHDVRYLWKATGGKGKGKATLGKCILTSGLVEYFSIATWVIWLAADWCREYEMNEDKVEALLYHEMLHMTLKESDEPGEDGVPSNRPHDFEAFGSEIRRYGFWMTDLELARDAVQGRLALEVANA